MTLKHCVNHLSTALQHSVEPEALFQSLVDELRLALPVDRCTLWLLDGEQLRLRWEAKSAAAVAEPWLGRTLSLQHWAEGRDCLLQNRVFQVRNRVDQRQRKRATLPAALDAQACLCLPIFAGGELVGLLGLLQTSGPLACTPTQLNLLRQLVQSVGLGLTQARLAQVEAQLRRTEQQLQQAQAQQVKQQPGPAGMLSERKRAEAELRGLNAVPEQRVIERAAELSASEARYRILASASPVGIFHTDVQGCLLYANERWCEIAGLSLREAVGDGWTQIVHPQDRERVITTWSQALRTHLRFEVEYRYLTPQGKTVWLIGQALPVCGDGGEVTGYVGSITDITERKRTEEALQASEERYRALYEDNPSMYFTVSEAGLILSVNAFGVAQLGYTAPELVGRSVFDLCYAEDQAAVQQCFQDCLQHPSQIAPWEFRKIRKDGSLVWVKQSARTVCDSSGHSVVLLVCEDITERKRTEEALRRSEARYRAIIEDQTDLVCRSLPNGVMTFANEAFCRYFGKQGNRLIGRKFVSLILDEDREQVEMHLSSLNRDQPVATIEQRIRLPNGEIRWQQWANRAISFDPQGRPIELQSVGQDITERKRVEQALRQSEERFRTLVSNILGAVYRCTNDGGWTVEFISEAIAQISGYAAAEFMQRQRTLTDICHPEDRELCRRTVQQSLAQQQPYTLEYRVMRADGSVSWVSENGQGVYAEDGRVLWADGVIFDITERRRHQEQLRILESAIANAHDVVLITEAEPLDEPGPRLVYVNEAFSRTTGYGPQEVLGCSPRLLQGPKTDRATLDQVRAALQAWQPVNAEVLNYRKDGSEFWAELSIVPVANPSGCYTHWVGVQRDITERKRMEEALQFTQFSVDHAADAILWATSDGRFFGVNEAACRVYGYSRQALLSLAVCDVDPAYSEADWVRHWQNLKQWGALTVEALHRAHDGRIFPVEVAASYLEFNGQEYNCAFVRDITERKRAEALERANRSLEQANANLSRLEKLKSELVATVSHEIRMPITTVCTAISALTVLGDKLEPRAKKVLQAADSEARRLARLVNDLLDFSKLDSGTYRWREERVELNSVLTQAVRASRVLYESRHLRLHCATTELPLHTWGDPERLIQLVVNLLDNAAKFSSPQGQVWLGLERRGECAVVSVQDEGPGIPEADRDLIFELFGQLSQPTGKRPQGIGLGLHLCRQIAQHHNGRITIESELGQGSRFVVCLPCLETNALAPV